MSLVTVRGIVLNSFDYNENDKVVTIFSENYGKISFISLGVNKPTSKNKYSLITFSLSEFSFFKSRQISSLSKLKTGYLVKENLQISQNYDDYLYASAIAGIIIQGMENWQKNFKLFTNLNFALQNFNQNKDSFTTFVYLLFFHLKNFGGFWILDSCSRCSKRYKSYRLFSFLDYGLVCLNCCRTDEKIQNPIWIQFLQKLGQQTFSEALASFKRIDWIIVLGKILIEYYQFSLGISNLSLQKILEKPFLNDQSFANYTDSVLTK